MRVSRPPNPTPSAPANAVPRGSPRDWSRLGPVLLASAFVCLAVAPAAMALGRKPLVASAPSRGSFPLVARGVAVPIVVDAQDHAGVRRAAGDLQQDVERVTGARPERPGRTRRRRVRPWSWARWAKSGLIDRLVQQGKLDVREIRGRWESSLIQVVERPWPGVDRALVIAGSDKRGTIFGIYDLSEQIGVSPWYWWADVPVRHRERALRRAPADTLRGEPAVQVPRHLHQRRGARRSAAGPSEKFGGFNQPVLRARLRADAAAAGQLPLAGDVGQRLRRRRPAEPAAGRRVRHRHGHLAPRADDARPRRVAALRQGPVELRDQRRDALRDVLDRGHRAHRRPTRASSPSACAATATSR